MKLAIALLLLLVPVAMAQEPEPVVAPPVLFWVPRVGPVTAIDEAGKASAGMLYRALGFKGRFTGLPLSLELALFVTEDGEQRFGAGPFVGFYRQLDPDAGVRVSVGVLAVLEPSEAGGKAEVKWMLAAKFSPGKKVE